MPDVAVTILDPYSGYGRWRGGWYKSFKIYIQLCGKYFFSGVIQWQEVYVRNMVNKSIYCDGNKKGKTHNTLVFGGIVLSRKSFFQLFI